MVVDVPGKTQQVDNGGELHDVERSWIELIWKVSLECWPGVGDSTEQPSLYLFDHLQRSHHSRAERVSLQIAD